MEGEKIRKDKVKGDPAEMSSSGSKPRTDTPNTPHGHSDKVRQSPQNDR